MHGEGSVNMESRQLDQLLDQLVACTGCQYQSDLRRTTRRKALSQAIERIDAGSWTAETWRKAALYLTGVEDIPGDAAQVRGKLLEMLKGALGEPE